MNKKTSEQITLNENRHTMLNIAILDLNAGLPNQGMRCIRQILQEWSADNGIAIQQDEFEVRLQNKVPDLSYDVYISSGGPGSPLEVSENGWEGSYFAWIDSVLQWNANPANSRKKSVFFVCHSFQLACRHLEVGEISKRRKTSFGVYPTHVTWAGQHEPVLRGLPDPFYVVDSREYQVCTSDADGLQAKGPVVLCVEKYRKHVDLPQALMALRFNEYMIGTQFHPEADARGMSMYLQREDKKQTVIENHGEAKWLSMIDQLNDPDKIMWTYAHILPNFLNKAAKQLIPVLAV